MSVIIRIAIEDDETLFTPEKYQILPILVFLCSSAKKTAGVFFAEYELLSPGCPELIHQKNSSMLSFHFVPVSIYNKKNTFSRFFMLCFNRVKVYINSRGYCSLVEGWLRIVYSV